MATKQEEVNAMTRGEGCLGKAAPDEPVFILRGQDIYAAGLVLKWAELAAQSLGFEHSKVKEAIELSEKMRRWPNRKKPD